MALYFSDVYECLAPLSLELPTASWALSDSQGLLFNVPKHEPSSSKINIRQILTITAPKWNQLYYIKVARIDPSLCGAKVPFR